jgi:pimeloyl-ACP methyl ester carboxylesterase
MARPLDHISPRLTRLGPPPGQARREVLFLHGAWVGAWHLMPLAQAAAQAGFGANLLDLPGHGQGAWDLPAGTGLLDYALVAARAAGPLGRPILVGHSLGGWLAQKLLEVVDLPCLLLCPLPGAGLPWTRLARLLALDPLGLGGPFLGRPLKVRDTGILRRTCLLDLPQEEVEAMFARLAPEPARAGLDMGLGLARARPGPGLGPRLVVAAERDFFLPPARLASLARRLGADYTLLPGYPHNCWQEDPDGRVAELLLGFLRSCPVG